ncbi:MAG: hybrid sensor histidine kinase/response regulator [Gemmataceae bacterium]
MKTFPESPDRGPIRVLLVDDDPDDYLLTRDLLDELPDHPFRLDWAASYDEGLAAAGRGEHDVYLLDYRLGVFTGLELLAEIRRQRPDAVVILLTGQGERAIDIAAMQTGAAVYLEKARLDPVLLERSIRYALLQKEYEAKLEHEVRERTRELQQANEALQREIAERKRAEAALREADRRKDEFLATLAHELRNPLAPIRHALEIIRLAGTNQAAVEQARTLLERQVGHLVRLIDDLLDVSRLTRGKLRLVKEPITLQQVIHAALENSGPVLERAGLSLHVRLAEPPIDLIGDVVRLAQAVSNLLNNTAKYTPRGGAVWVTAEVDGNEAVVRIRDTGIGITPDLLPHMFELFTPQDRTAPYAQGGLGVGLALVRQFIELHGGSVTVFSEGTNKGTEFTIRLPLAAK